MRIIWKYGSWMLGGIIFGMFLERIYLFGFFQLNKDTLSAGSQVVIAYVALVALGQLIFAYEVNRATQISSIVGFFRTQLVINNSSTGIKSISMRYVLNYTEIIDDEDLVIFKDFYYKIMVANPQNCYNKMIEYLNATEEMSINVIYNNLTQNEALVAIREAYVEAIEEHANALYALRRVSKESAYPNTIELYRRWKSKVGLIEKTKAYEKLKRFVDNDRIIEVESV